MKGVNASSANKEVVLVQGMCAQETAALLSQLQSNFALAATLVTWRAGSGSRGSLGGPAVLRSHAWDLLCRPQP